METFNGVIKKMFKCKFCLRKLKIVFYTRKNLTGFVIMQKLFLLQTATSRVTVLSTIYDKISGL